MLPLFRGDAAKWRKDFLVEYFSDTVFPRIQRMGYQAVRSEGWKLIHYTELAGMDEFYDLRSDPFEMRNLIDEPAAAEALAKHRVRLEQLRIETGAR